VPISKGASTPAITIDVKRETETNTAAQDFLKYIVISLKDVKPYSTIFSKKNHHTKTTPHLCPKRACGVILL
jgi:hypothetical protein